MKAFVAGATGYTGRELVRVLCERGMPTVAHVRPDSPRLPEWQDRFSALGAEVDTTPWERVPLRATLVRVRPTQVFALLGTTRARAQAEGRGAADAYEAVDYGLSALLHQAVREAAPDARFIYLSSMGASERGNAYLRVRGRFERELRASGLSWIVARPAFISGSDREERRTAERVMAEVSDTVLDAFARIGLRGPAARWRSLTGAQLARGLAQLAATASDGIYDAAAIRRAAGAPSGSSGRGT